MNLPKTMRRGIRWQANGHDCLSLNQNTSSFSRNCRSRDLTNAAPLPSFNLAVSSGMWKCGFQVRNPGKKYGLSLVMMVRLKHKLVPVVCAEAEFQQLVEPFTIIVTVSFEQRSFKELHPVILRRLDQDVRRCEEHMKCRQFRHQRGQSPDIPEFTGFSLVACGAKA